MAKKEKKEDKIEKENGEEDKEELERNLKNQKKQEMQIKWVLIVSGLVVVAFLGTYFYTQSLNRFEKFGVEWQRVKEGDLVFYHTQFKFFNGTPVYSLNLRNDPRKNDVLINTNVNDFRFTNKKAVISFDPGMDVCKGLNSMIKISLSDFFSALGYEKIEGAVTEQEYAIENKLPYANCDSVVGKTVVEIRRAEKDSIEQVDSDCYIINIGECKTKAVEKFILGLLEKFED